MTIPLTNPAQVFVFCLAIVLWTSFTAWAASSEGNDWAKLFLSFFLLVFALAAVLNLIYVIDAAL